MLQAFYNWLVLSLRLMAFKRVPRKFDLIVSYGKIHFRHQLSRLFKTKPASETFLGYKIDFFNYGTFVYLFEEIFMQQTYFFESTNPMPVMIDCGSNIGLSILYLKNLYPDSKIIAFEPDPKTFLLLQKNIRQNKLTGVELHNKAITNYDGVIEFYRDQNKEGSLVMGLHPSRGAVAASKVECTSLSHFLDRKVDFLKMDIEGAEALSFHDLDQKNKLANIQQLVLECHHNIQEAPILSEILPLLEKNRFKYQMSANLKSPYPKNTSQDVMIYAYKDL
jgi:FkbM family methyltransferase